MIFAGQKLRRHPALDNPTVLIVVDRRDLKTQLADDFDACDYPSVEKALGVEDLKRRLRADWRGTLVTTIQAFQNMGDLPSLTRDSVISMVDECHRSQKGRGRESFAMTMRVKLANGFRYGFTGTPIDRTMQNTHRDFGALKDGVQERYLSYYGIRRAIRDGATLEVHYRRDKVPFEVDEERLSVGFEDICAEMELEDEEAKDFVQRQRSRWKELARDPARIDTVVERMLTHFLEHPDPRSLERIWEAVAPDPCLYPHRQEYNWLCGIYVAHRRRQGGSRDTYQPVVVRREKAPFLSGWESRPATVAPAGSSRSGRWRQRHRLKHSDDQGPPRVAQRPCGP